MKQHHIVVLPVCILKVYNLNINKSFIMQQCQHIPICFCKHTFYMTVNALMPI